MVIYKKTYKYFQELSQIPRQSKDEEGVRIWLKNWSKRNNWKYEEDSIGNLLIYALGNTETTLCLQSHMDMVCVSEEKEYDFENKGIEIIDEDGVLRGNKTTLGADNGIGVAVMMAIAEIKERPHLELLFTMGEEIGLIGAHHIELPITALKGINLDWCESENAGIGCGGTILMKGNLQGKKVGIKKGKNIKISILGMRGGHSGVEIQYNRGNALVELCKIISNDQKIIAVSSLKGGDADNAIPRKAHATVLYTGKLENLELQLEKEEKKLRKKYNYESITIKSGEVDKDELMYDKSLCLNLVKIHSGVQIWDDTKTNPLSSWNLGKLKLAEGHWEFCFFIRTNIPGDLIRMKEKIMKKCTDFDGKLTWNMSHEGPVWYADNQSDFVKKILQSIKSYNGKSIEAITTHATMECGTLAEKYPCTEWISIGVTCHDMHTTREHIYLSDLEEFCERLERVIQSY